MSARMSKGFVCTVKYYVNVRFIPPCRPYIPQRTLFNFFRRDKRAGDTKSSVEYPDLISAEWLKQQEQAKERQAKQLPTRGDLASSSIFSGEEPAAEATEEKPIVRDPSSMAPVLDPVPKAREQWQRRRVIHEVKHRGRLTKKELLMRTERELLHKSVWITTSLKKLGPLARQIQGKTVEEALIQMRYSNKKAARAVLQYLVEARDLAIASRGMGLGKTDAFKPVTITLKDGRKKTVTDPTEMYVDQAWVGRGSYAKRISCRARGRTDMIRSPHTSISFLLKEEKTRIREHEEREQKRANRKLWVQLPDRPITAQRQYYSW